MEKSLKTYEDYFSQSVEERLLHYEKEGHLQHVMLSHQFSISLMEELFDIADHVKEMTRKPNGIEFLKSLLCVSVFTFFEPVYMAYKHKCCIEQH